MAAAHDGSAMTPRKIHRLLIANRGEIAVRIARTARRLGIATVGVYSEVDRHSLHVEKMDLAIALGGEAAADSYLRSDLLIAAAQRTGCDAVHPGYGFLAENAEFADAVIAAGLTWVGAQPEQIRLLGDKMSAKEAARAAGVPATSAAIVNPGDIADPEAAAPSILAGFGLPVIVKAIAGGGGRGMRVVRSEAELTSAVESASREALAAFGDGRVFLEPYLEHGRHIEVQIFGDSRGSVIHLGERECSIQRRNQKVIEEAPSAGISAEVRARLCESAVALGRSVNYLGAGTVEFLVGEDGVISFLEVNTRLQVEHPVTEAVTGIDLVELQLRIAAGEPLPLTQRDVEIRGHAIEARIVAEDPTAHWIPSTGKIELFEVGPGVRVDTGVSAGSEVGSNYDSLLAKVIAHGDTRSEAKACLGAALIQSSIFGVATNLHMLIATIAESDFSNAITPTSYLESHPEVAADSGPEGEDRLALLMGAVFAYQMTVRRGDRCTSFAPSGWRNLPTLGHRQIWGSSAGDTAVEVEAGQPAWRGDLEAGVLVGPWPAPDDSGALGSDTRNRHRVRLLEQTSERLAIEVDGRHTSVTVHTSGATLHCSSRAGSLSFTLQPPFAVPLASATGTGSVSPLPGTVISVLATVGQAVTSGEVLMVVEAMKMEHQITASEDGTVAEVRFQVGARVAKGDLLVVVEAE